MFVFFSVCLLQSLFVATKHVNRMKSEVLSLASVDESDVTFEMAERFGKDMDGFLSILRTYELGFALLVLVIAGVILL